VFFRVEEDADFFVFEDFSVERAISPLDKDELCPAVELVDELSGFLLVVCVDDD